MSKRNGNCFARRAYHMSEPTALLEHSKNADAAHSGPGIGSVKSLWQRVSNHSNKRVDQMKNLKALATTRAVDETFR